VIVRLGSHAVDSLKDLSDTLKTLKPGDTISITFQREGAEKTVRTKVVAK
jgi:S1-C subfamily serine protease